MSAHLGIDLGTSAVKALVIDATGHCLAKARRAHPTHAPHPGWAEQAAEGWWQATSAAVAEAVAAAGVPVASVGLSGQLNGFVLLDAGDRPLAPAVIWLDIRAEAEAQRLAEARDFPALIGNALSPICVLPKLVWMQAHRPELMARARRIALVKDWLLLRLTGVLATDPSDASSTGLAGPGGTGWSAELCALAGIAPAMLPEIRPAAQIAGRVTATAAAETGLAAGTPVATGAGDVAALGVGCGIVAPGRTALTLGTAGHVVAETGAAGGAGSGGLWRIPHGVPGRALWLGLIMAGGLSLAWLRGVLGNPGFDALEAQAAAVPPGARGVTFLPFLEGAATPLSRPDARGAFTGLSSSHGAGEMVRAVMEGVAFNARDCTDALAAAGLPTRTLRLAEGGAQSALWCQIVADALEVPVRLVEEGDTSALGAAILGRAALEGAGVPDIAEACVRLGRGFEPDAAAQGAMAEAAGRYRDAIARLLAP